jgi:hypothetical protein
MTELVAAIATYSLWLYLLLALLVARELRTMWRAGTARDQAVFGLEREASSSRALRSLITLVLLVTIAAGVYTVTNLIAPTLPVEELRLLEESPIVAEPPPVPLPTDTATAAPSPTRHLPRIVTPPPYGTPGP